MKYTEAQREIRKIAAEQVSRMINRDADGKIAKAFRVGQANGALTVALNFDAMSWRQFDRMTSNACHLIK